MKIAMLGIKGIPACYGGFETVVDELSTRLVARGHEVTVYNRSTIIKTRLREYKGVKLITLPTFRSKHLSTIVHTFLSTLHIIFTDVDIIHYFVAGNSIFAWIPRLFGKKTVCSVDGLDWQRDKWGMLLRLYLEISEYFATVFPNVIITDATVIEQYYLQKYRKPSACIAYGANILSRNSNPQYLAKWGLVKDKYILWVGQLQPDNNVHHLIEAFQGLHTDLKLAIVGDSPYEKEYIARLKSTQNPNVVFTGYVFGEGYRELNCGTYLFAFPDKVGGTHPALIESMAFGNCVLVNDTPANLEVIGDAGVSYRGAEGAEDLRRELQRLIDDPHLVEYYRKKAVERIRAMYQWDSVVAAHEKLYLELLGSEQWPK